MSQFNQSEMKRLLELNMGFHLIPYTIKCQPMWKGYMTDPRVSITTVEELEQRTKIDDWKHGFGVVLHFSDLVMVDIDLHDEEAKNGAFSWGQVICDYSSADGETFPDELTTWSMGTPGNGTHYIFRRPADFPKSFTKRSFAPGVELIARAATPLPPTMKRRDDSWKMLGVYEWLDSIDPEAKALLDLPRGIWSPLGETPMRPGDFPLAPLPEWLTLWAMSPKTPLLSQTEYDQLMGRDPRRPPLTAKEKRENQLARERFQNLKSSRTAYIDTLNR